MEQPKASSARMFWLALWRDLPLGILVLFAGGIARAELLLLWPHRPDLLATCIGPLALLAVVYVGIWHRAARGRKEAGVGLIVAGGLIVIVSATLSPKMPVDAALLRSGYEGGVIACALLLLVHAWLRARGLVVLLGIAALYGVALVSAALGVGFWDTPGYRVHVPWTPAPLAMIAGWVVLFYLTLHVVWMVREDVPILQHNPLLGAVFGALAAMAFELQQGPWAAATGLVKWDAQLQSGNLGVPVVDFIEVGAAVLPLLYVVLKQQRVWGASPSEVVRLPWRRGLVWRAVAAMLVAVALFGGATAAVEGPHGPTLGIVHTAMVRVGLVTPDTTWQPGGRAAAPTSGL